MSTNTNYTVVIQQNKISVQAPIPEKFDFDSSATYETPLPQGITKNNLINVTAAAFGTRLAVQAFTAQLWSGNAAVDLAVDLEFHTETDPINDVRNPILNLLKMNMPSINSATGFLLNPGPSLDLSSVLSIGKDAVSEVGSDLKAVGGSLVSAAKSGFNRLTGNAPTPANLNNTNTGTTDSANSTVQSALQQNPSLGTAAYWKSQIKNPISIKIGNYMYFDCVVIERVSQTFTSNFDSVTGLPHHATVRVQFKPMFMLTQEDLETLFVNPNGGSTPGSSSPTIPPSQVGAQYGF